MKNWRIDETWASAKFLPIMQLKCARTKSLRNWKSMAIYSNIVHQVPEIRIYTNTMKRFFHSYFLYIFWGAQTSLFHYSPKVPYTSTSSLQYFHYPFISADYEKNPLRISNCTSKFVHHAYTTVTVLMVWKLNHHYSHRTNSSYNTTINRSPTSSPYSMTTGWQSKLALALLPQSKSGDNPGALDSLALSRSIDISLGINNYAAGRWISREVALAPAFIPSVDAHHALVQCGAAVAIG